MRVHRVDAVHQRVHIAEIATHVQGHLYVGPPKTRASHRTVPIPRFVADALTEHIESIGADQDDLVFPAPQGGHVRLDLWRRRTWAPGVKAAGLAHLRPHDLRHTAVALWIAAGASPKEIAARAGHTSVVTVLDRYGHLLPGHEEKVNDALDEMARVARPRLRVVPDKAPSEDMSRENPEIPRDVRAMNHSGRESAASEKAADQVVHEWAMGTRTPDLCRAKTRQSAPLVRFRAGGCGPVRAEQSFCRQWMGCGMGWLTGQGDQRRSTGTTWIRSSAA